MIANDAHSGSFRSRTNFGRGSTCRARSQEANRQPLIQASLGLTGDLSHKRLLGYAGSSFDVRIVRNGERNSVHRINVCLLCNPVVSFVSVNAA